MAILKIIVFILTFALSFLIIGYVVALVFVTSDQLFELIKFYIINLFQFLFDLSSHYLGYPQNITQMNAAQNSTLKNILDEYGVGEGMFSLIKIIAFLLIGLIIIGIFKHEEGVVVLPFEIGAGYKNYSGKAISDMLITGLKRIRKIHGIVNYEGIKPKEDVLKPMPRVGPPSENLTYNIAALGAVDIGSTSIPVGPLMITLRRLCPGASPGRFITGSLQKYGSEISLMAHMENKKIHTWRVQSNSSDYSQIPRLVRDLSFKIAHDLHDEGTTKTWQGFKYFTEALDAYGRYTKTKDTTALESAHMSALKAANAESDYDNPSDVLYNIGIVYLNKKRYKDAERLFRQMVVLKPDSYKALLGWGMALRRLCLDEQAIKCYEKVLKNKPECAEALCMKAISLRNQGDYDKAIKCFDEALEIKPDYAYALQYKGICLEARANQESGKDKVNKYKINKYRDDAIEAYERALKLEPELKLCRPSLARLYKKQKRKQKRFKYKDVEKNHKNLCEDFRETVWLEEEYNQACYWAICENNTKKALDLLKIALKEPQVSRSWAEEDPDFELIRHTPRFKETLDDYPTDFNDPEVRVSKIAVYRKLGSQKQIEDQIESAYELVKDENEYLQARYYAVCYEVKCKLDDDAKNKKDNMECNVEHNANEALRLLRIALWKRQVIPDEARFDPDFEFIRDNPRFEERFHKLIDDFAKDC